MDPVNIPAKFEVRSFTRSWDNRGYSKNLGSPWIRPRFIFSKNFKGFLFGWTLWIYLPNLKFVALFVPEIIGAGIQKIWAVPVYAHAPFSPNFLIGFCSDEPCDHTCQIWSLYSFTHSWDNRGYFKNLGSPWIRPRSLFSNFFTGLSSDGPFEYTCQIWSP